MKKTYQGRYEIFTTKTDAIKKFMQINGMSREELSGERHIEFSCFENGKIIITNPWSRYITNYNSTNLYAEVIGQDGKTYVEYYTSFSKSVRVLKIICYMLNIILAIIGIILGFICDNKLYAVAVLALCLALFIYGMYNALNEENNSPKDSQILINELENRVEAVNLWDK